MRETKAETKTKRILVVEDDTVDLMALIRNLEQGLGESAKCIHANKIRDAKHVLENGGVDIILLDLGLPDAAGLDSVLHLKATAPDVPLVVVSGTDPAQLARQVIALGAEDFLAKDSVTPRGLASSIDMATERHRAKVRMAGNLSRMAESLEKMTARANTDPLTGLSNRRGLIKWLESFCAQGGEHLFAATVAVNDLSRVTARAGFRAAESLVVDLVVRLDHHLEGKGFIARVGEGSFVVIFTENSRTRVRDASERMFRAVTKLPYLGPDGLQDASVSMVVMEFRGGVLDLERIYLEASRSRIGDKGGRRAGLDIRWLSGDEEPVDSPPGMAVAAADCHVEGVISTAGGELIGYGFKAGDSFSRKVLAREPLSANDHPAEEALALNLVEEALYWSASAGGKPKLFVRVPAGSLTPALARSVVASLPDPEDRKKVCLVIPSYFSRGLAGVIAEAASFLSGAGVDLGMSQVGGGRTVLDSLLQLNPRWLFLDVLLVDGVARLGTRREMLGRFVESLKGMDAELIADGVRRREDASVLREAGVPWALVQGASGLRNPGQRVLFES